MTDPSGAEMRSPNGVCGRAFSNMGEFNPALRCALPLGHEGKHATMHGESKFRWAENRSDYEEAMNGRATDATGAWAGGGAAPRSSEGSPLSAEQVAEVRLAYDEEDWDELDFLALCDSHEALRTQVSALRQEAATLGDSLHKSETARGEQWNELRDTQQEIEDLRGLLGVEAHRHTAARQEAETLRGQLDEAQRHFRMYGQHDASCWLYRSGPCDCGFNEALAAARVAAPREPK